MAVKPKTMLDDEAVKLRPADSPVNPDLTEEMMIDVAVNRKAEVWAFHNKPFPGVLEWVEYDIDDGRLVFVTKGGKLNDFGITIGPLMRKYLKRARYVDAYLVRDRKIYDFIRVSLVARETVH